MCAIISTTNEREVNTMYEFIQIDEIIEENFEELLQEVAQELYEAE